MMVNDRFTWGAGDVIITDRDGTPIDTKEFAAAALAAAENDNAEK